MSFIMDYDKKESIEHDGVKYTVFSVYPPMPVGESLHFLTKEEDCDVRNQHRVVAALHVSPSCEDYKVTEYFTKWLRDNV